MPLPFSRLVASAGLPGIGPILVQSAPLSGKVLNAEEMLAMRDQEKTKEQLIAELEQLRRSAVHVGANGQGNGAIITKHKQADDALRESEERFRLTFEEAPVGMVIGVGKGVIAKANRALCRMSGYNEEELVGRLVRDLAHPEDRDLSDPLVKKFFAGEIPSFTLERRYLRKDGQPFWARATTAAARGPDGKIAFALGIVEDITERKRAGEEKLEMERRLLHAQKLESLGVLAGGIAHDFNNILAGIMGYADLALVRLPASEPARADIEVIKQACTGLPT